MKKIAFCDLLFQIGGIIYVMNSTNDNIEHIIELCQSNDNEGKKALFEMYSPQMLALCYRYIGNKQDAEDVMLDGFIHVFEQIGKYKSNNFYAWMCKLMVNECLMFIRSENRFILRDTGYYNNSEEDTEIDNPERFTMEDLMKALEILPKSLRSVFNLSVIEEYSHDEICKILNVKKRTVVTALHKAKLWMKDYLTELEKNRGQKK